MPAAPGGLNDRVGFFEADWVSRRVHSTRRGLETMTHGRMQTMTQGRDGISLAHRAALGCLAVARRLSVVVLVMSIAALMAGTPGTSYAKKPTLPPGKSTEQTVVVSNFGSLFAGS